MISGLRQAPCYDAAQFLSQLLAKPDDNRDRASVAQTDDASAASPKRSG